MGSVGALILHHSKSTAGSHCRSANANSPPVPGCRRAARSGRTLSVSPRFASKSHASTTLPPAQSQGETYALTHGRHVG